WGSSNIRNAGVENLLIDETQANTGGNGLIGVSVMQASNVWVKGIASNKANVLHVLMYIASNVTIRDSYYYFTKNGGTTSYGVGSTGASGGVLIENNIFQGITSPITWDGTCT